MLAAKANKAMTTYHGAKVTGFPQEKFEDIQSLDENGDQHRAADIAIQIVLLEGVAKYQHLPQHHTESAVGELLCSCPAAGRMLELRSRWTHPRACVNKCKHICGVNRKGGFHRHTRG